MVRFGENISIIQKRVTFENRSILEVYEKAIEIFRDYYQYEEIKGADRKKIEKIPEAAFREAIANGLIHRIWDVESQIRVLMFEDRIEVVSPGVFYRLGFVEIFGTGIMRIRQLYEKSLRKPEFEVSENAIQIVLPVWESNLDLTEDEKMIYGILSKNRLKSMGEIAPYVSFGRSKTTKLLKEMEEKGIITVEGKGRNTKYSIK